MLKRIITVGVAVILLAESAVFGAGFRFSPNPNKAHLVQWRSWSAEALDEARKGNKLVLLSLSAVWCHWCHVMDETTYSDEAVIAFINEHFIPIRVDADMRPDLDSLYNQGGWPSTVVLTPGGEIVAGGNYLPPAVMLQALRNAADQNATDPESIARGIEGAELFRSLQEEGMKFSPDQGDLSGIEDILKEAFDEAHGGFGSGQKFPNPHALEFLLSRYAANRDGKIKTIIMTTLDRMASGGIHDRREGGFFRYATKADWSEPHYEKMLDVNAGLIAGYAGAALLFKEDRYRTVVRKSVRYVRNTLYDGKSGALYGSQDADEAYYQARDRAGMRAPFVDRTTYADSASLMISALVAAWGATGEKRDLAMAANGATFVLRNMYREREGVFHAYRDGVARLPGMLSDNALFGAALLDLYTATGEQRYLAAARKIGRLITGEFHDQGSKQFRSLPGASLTRPKTAGALAGINHNLANYRAIQLLARLAAISPIENAEKLRDEALMTFSGVYRKYTPHAPAYGNALRWNSVAPVEITVINGLDKAREYLAIAGSMFIPEKVVRVLSLSRDRAEIERLNYPLREAVYICAGTRCSAPIRTPERFRAELQTFLKGKEE